MWMDSSASGWLSPAAAQEATIKECAVAKATEDPRAPSRSQLHKTNPRGKPLLLPRRNVKIREDAPIWKRNKHTQIDLGGGAAAEETAAGSGMVFRWWKLPTRMEPPPRIVGKTRVARERARERGERARRAHPPQWSRKPYGKSPASPKPYPKASTPCLYSCLWMCVLMFMLLLLLFLLNFLFLLFMFTVVA